MNKAKSISLIIFAVVILVEGLFYIYGAEWLRIDEKFKEEMGEAIAFARSPSYAYEERILKLIGLTAVVGTLILLALPKNKKA